MNLLLNFVILKAKSPRAQRGIWLAYEYPGHGPPIQKAPEPELLVTCIKVSLRLSGRLRWRRGMLRTVAANKGLGGGMVDALRSP